MPVRRTISQRPAGILAILVVTGILSPGTARAQEPARVIPTRNVVDVGTMLHRYTDDIQAWNGLYLRTQVASGARNVWAGEVLAEDRLGEQAFSYKMGYVLDLPSWFARADFRTSTSGIYNPRWRSDLRLGVKTGPERRLLLSGAGFMQEIRDGHEDFGFIAEAQYYGDDAWIVQGAVRFTNSRPGDVWSTYFDAAVILGRFGSRYVTFHGAAGREAYQVLGPLNVLTDFRSWMAQVTWREWLSSRVGFHVSGIYYSNEFYQRAGGEAGLFFHFNRP